MIARILTATAVLFASPVFAQEAKAAPKKPILLVLTNHAKLGNSGKRTGFFLSEAAHPWEVFSKAGYPVTLASPVGGFAPLDPKSYDLKDEANAAFWKKVGSGEEKNNTLGVRDTKAVMDLNPADFSAVFFAGGHGTMWDFRQDKAIQRFTATVYEDGGAVGAVCHGPAALIDVKLTDGTPLVKGKKVAGFTNAEEEAVGLTTTVPYLLQSELEAAGATHVPGENFKENAVLDGRLATGQNPASAKKAAELLVEALASDETDSAPKAEKVEEPKESE
ncbi:type 1 glutamine amidotransferase domain-containing protein [Luteolibacter luteus]|uniref:Type 1 glutamine amidotransferase domain-containing protein n=1 Tax=Luteolibacter luteus TaxID=2728835 RepID=A0A858RHV1_9BACT|nr:type 1 glutamine amidotransferase domain-containing protein [Luteolibacter luteus]QJE96088.1 type 1 glutamine amidotransferase domain-containing protein [Luteolibacter luteus]